MKINDLTIVVCCNREDFFMARICIASIRYYYPDVPIEIVKDPGNGDFDSKELERHFSVKNIDLGIKKMGWSGAKFHYLYQSTKGRKVLLLDADIVFIGPFLERLLSSVEENDYVISADQESNPYAEWVKKDYFDTKKIEAKFPSYRYPGYFFNAGQIFVTTGSIAESVLNNYFDAANYPYWRNKEMFPMVDQSVYNFLLPALSGEKKLKLGKDKFMLWSKSTESQGISLNDVAGERLNLGLIHWAGCARTSCISGMVRRDILAFFEDYYYSRIKWGSMLKITRNVMPGCKYRLKQLYHLVKPSSAKQGKKNY